MTYRPLFTQILDSSIWLETAATRIVWMTLIAAMDDRGVCSFASSVNLAHRARVSPEEAAEAIRILESPDPNSSDPSFDGRRIQKVTGGWKVLSFERYAAIAKKSDQREKTRERVARHRAAKKSEALPPPTSAAPAGSDELPIFTGQDEIDRQRSAGAVAKSKKSVPASPLACRLAQLYRRRLDTEWSAKEIAAFRAANPSDEDVTALEQYYLAEMEKGADGVHRRDLGTLLNNWRGEIDRALAYRALKERKPNGNISKSTGGGSPANTQSANSGAAGDY